MIVKEAKYITDKEWKSFALKFSDEIKSSRYSKHPIKGWEELKKEYINNCSNLKPECYNFFVVFDDNDDDDDNNPVTWFDVSYSSKAMFDFEKYYSNVSDETFKYVFSTLIDFIEKLDKDEIYTIEESEKLIDSFMKMGAEVYDEPTYTILKKKDVDMKKLNEICSSDIGDLKLALYEGVPEEIFESFIELNNEAMIDKEKFHPKKKTPSNINRDDLLRAIDMKDTAGHPFYMYVLMDRDKVVAFSSVYIRDGGKSIDHVGSLALTTVGRNYRGRGLARFLKANMYMKLLTERPEIEYMITDTYSWNKYMYKINEEFGFIPFKKTVRFRLTKEFLKNYIKK